MESVQSNICAGDVLFVLQFIKKSLYNENLINDNGIWRTRYSNELYTHYDALDIVKVLKIERLRWLEHLARTQELDPCRKLTLLKPEGTLHVGKPKLW